MANPETRTITIPFAWGGQALKKDAGDLADSEYQYAINVTSRLDGSVCSRYGRKMLGRMDAAHITEGAGWNAATPHTIFKMRLSGPSNPDQLDSENLRYVGEGVDIYRTKDYANFTRVASSIDDSLDVANLLRRRWTMATYSAGTSGDPWAYFATPRYMLRDHGSEPYATLRRWGILPAAGVAEVTAGVVGTSGPDGGALGAPDPSDPYDYRFCWVNGVTGEIGNPSQPMGTRVGSHFQPLTVTVWGTDDPQVDKIYIYRRGGMYSDGLYRRVGFVDNPGGTGGEGNPAEYIDEKPDTDLLYAPLMEFDNDPPVTSTLPKPINTTLFSIMGSPGWCLIALEDTSFAQIAQAGTQIMIGAPSGGAGGNTEIVTLYSINPDTGILYGYCQYAHASGDQVTCSTITAQPCTGTFSAFDSLFVYGDPNNPQNLYKSKTGRPASFPVINAQEMAQVVGVGSPSNGIMAGCEFAGDILCLNVSNLFIVRVWQGVLQSPIATPAQRGLLARWAWCLADNTVYYLAYDGIYAWRGGEAVCISDEIAPIFQGQWANTVPPMDLSDVAGAGQTAPVNWIKFNFWRKQLFVMYRDLAGKTRVIAYNTLTNRWELAKWSGIDSIAIETQPTTLFTEPDNGRFIVARYSLDGGAFSEYGLEYRHSADPANYIDGIVSTSDEWTSTGEEGAAIDYSFKTGFHHLGAPAVQKVFEEIWLEIENPVEVTGKVYLDYKGVAVTQTWTIAAGARRRISMLHAITNFPVSGTPEYGSIGLEAYAIAFEFSGSGKRLVTFFGLTYSFHELGRITAGAATPWKDLGWPYDKRLYTLWVKYDTGGTNQDILVDCKGGINGNVLAAGTDRFTLSNDTAVPTGRTFETSRTFPLGDGLVAKLVRLRPVVAAAGVATPTLKIIDWDIRYEKLPEDVVYFSSWYDNGGPYLKYFEQLILEVDTNNKVVPFKIQADGADVFTGLTVQSTLNDTHRVITLPGNRTFRQARVVLDVANFPADAKFQLMNVQFISVPADKGPVTHTFDYDDLGHPWDKRLHTATLEWDNTGGAAIELQLDLRSGINGETLQADVARFTIAANGRSKRTWGLPDGLICKLIRIHPVNQTMPITLRHWEYKFDFEPFPADIVYFTEPKDFGYPYEKIARNLIVKVDTGGQDATVNLVGDGTVRDTFVINTTLDDWRRMNAVKKDQIAKLWKLAITPHASGKFQLFEWDLDHIKEPAYINYWRSYEQALGYKGWKFIKQAWLQYIAPSGIILTIDSDTGQWTHTFPAHTDRAVERYLLPAVFGVGLNKSKKYIFTLGPAGLDSPNGPSMQFGIPGNFAAGQTMTLNIDVRVGYRFSRLDWNISADVGQMPVGSNAVIDVQLSKDKGATWNSIFGSGNEITISPGGANYGSISTFALSGADVGDWLKVVCLQAGSTTPGGGLQALMYGGNVAVAGPLFKVYPDASGFEWLPIGGDRHAAYQQTPLSEFWTFPI